jgi:uncharacterized membrane protein
MVGVHGLFMIVFGRLFRLPMFYLATASQACIGGPVSTPIVAGVYQPALIHVGVILALIGGAIGTYIGLLGAAVSSFVIERRGTQTNAPKWNAAVTRASQYGSF